MSRFKMLIKLLLVSAMLIDQQLVLSDRNIGYLHDINAKHDQLDRDFISRTQEIFYDTQQQVAEAEEKYPLLAIASAMAEYEAAWYAAQRRGLICAEVLLIRYFIARSTPLDRILIESDSLIDMIIKRAMERSIKDPKVVAVMEKHRKRVYLYLSRYTDEVAGAEDLAHKYAKNIVSMKAMTMLARREFEQASAVYRTNTPLMEFEGFAASTMVALETLIDQTLFDREVTEMEMIQDYRALTMDTIAARLRTHYVVEMYDEDFIDSVNMDDVSAYEDAILRGPVGLFSYVRDMDLTIDVMERKLADTMQIIFYNQQELAKELGSYPLMAISCIMAEIEGLIFADRRRMLLNIKGIIAQQTQKFEWLFAVNENSVEFIVQHLIGYSLEQALNRVEYRRKRLYLSLMRYEPEQSVRELARVYYKHMYNLKNQLRETVGLSELYRSRVMTGTTRDQLPMVVDNINQMIERGVVSWTMKVKDMRLLKMTLDKVLFTNITTSYKNSFNKIFRPSTSSIISVTMEDINEHERGLLGHR